MNPTSIDPGLSVNEIVRRWPPTIAVMNDFGIDACCGGADPLDVAAARDGAPLDALLAALHACLEGGNP
jgi:iron-sulfur cluster repair protein YtfE (RIC family)